MNLFSKYILEFHPDITNIDSDVIFRNAMLKTIRLVPNHIFDACDPLGVQLLKKFRVGLSHLGEHKFRHGFNDAINPICACNREIESVFHFYLGCPNNINEHFNLMNELSNLYPTLVYLDSNSLTLILLYGNKSFTDDINSKIITFKYKFYQRI